MAGTPTFVTLPPNSTGSNIQAWSNTVSAATVLTEAVTPTNSSGVEIATSSNPVRTDPTGTTPQPVTATSLPLPSNAAQETGGNLATLATNLPAKGQALAAASLPVVLTAIQQTALTPPTAAAIGTSVSADLLIGTQVAGSSVPVALPSATITSLTPPSAAAIASAIVANPPAVTITSGTTTVTQATGTNLHVVVDTAPSTAVTNAGTFPVQSTPVAQTTLVLGTVRTVGNLGAAFDAATNAAPPANAVQVGAVAATALPSAFTATDLVPPMADKFGRLVTLHNGMRDIVGSSAISNNSTASGVSFIAAIASTFTDISTFVATNRSATATIVTLTDGSNSFTYALAANGGIVINFPTPLPATTSNTAWTIGNSATVACDYSVVFIKNK